MSETTRSVTIRVEIDTNKATYAKTFENDLQGFVEWWNAHDDKHGLSSLTIDEDMLSGY
jgi:hypothetical protein